MSSSISRRQLFGAAGALALPSIAVAQQAQSLLNVSYDVSREFCEDFNAAFAAHWKKTTGQDVTLNQSHGGSSRQARSVADGLEADVITMNQHNDIDILHTRGGLVPANWATRLPNNASPTTFAQRNLGDALVTFESEAPLITREFGDGFELVCPSRTILAENPVSVVDRVVDKRGTRKLAEAYVQYHYSPEGQEIAAKHHLRPRDAKVLAKYAKQFPKVTTFTVDEVFGGWTKAQAEHFNDGGHYDQVILAAKGR